MWKHKETSIGGMDTKGKNLPQSNAGMSVKLRLFRIGAILSLRRDLTCWNLTLDVRSWYPRKMSLCARGGRNDSPGHVNGDYNIKAGWGGKCGGLTDWQKSVCKRGRLHETR